MLSSYQGLSPASVPSEGHRAILAPFTAGALASTHNHFLFSCTRRQLLVPSAKYTLGLVVTRPCQRRRSPHYAEARRREWRRLGREPW